MSGNIGFDNLTNRIRRRSNPNGPRNRAASVQSGPEGVGKTVSRIVVRCAPPAR